MPFVPLIEQNKMTPSSIWQSFQYLKTWSGSTTIPFLIPSPGSQMMILKSPHTPGLRRLCMLQVANAPVLVWWPRLKTVLHCGLVSREESTTVISHILALNSSALQAANVKNNEPTGTSNTWNPFTQSHVSPPLHWSIWFWRTRLWNFTFHFPGSLWPLGIFLKPASFTDLTSVPSMSWSKLLIKLLNRPGTSLQASKDPLVTGCEYTFTVLSSPHIFSSYPQGHLTPGHS